MKQNLRDHGYGDTSKPAGVPVAVSLKKPMMCPNCGCGQVMHVEVPVVNPLLKGGAGRCVYQGCPACPWAGPAINVATAPKNPTDG